MWWCGVCAGPSVVGLWTSLRGDAWVKETIALAVPPLEREAGPACRPDSSIDAFSNSYSNTASSQLQLQPSGGGGEAWASEPYTRAITRYCGRQKHTDRGTHRQTGTTGQRGGREGGA